MPLCMVIGGGPVLTFRSKAVGVAAMANMDGGPPSASRYLIASFMWADGGGIGAPTIGGVAASMIGAPVSVTFLGVTVTVHMGIALVPNNQFVAVGIVGSPGAGPVCALHSLVGIASPIPTMALNVDASTFAAPAASAIVGVSCAVSNPSPTATWTGLTTDNNDHFGSGNTRTGSAAHRQVDQAIASLTINPSWVPTGAGHAGKITMWQ